MQDQNLEQMKGTSSFWLLLLMQCILDLTSFCHSKEHKYYWRKQTCDILQNCINIFHITLCICDSWSSSTAALMLLLPYGWPCAFIYSGSVVHKQGRKRLESHSVCITDEIRICNRKSSMPKEKNLLQWTWEHAKKQGISLLKTILICEQIQWL